MGSPAPSVITTAEGVREYAVNGWFRDELSGDTWHVHDGLATNHSDERFVGVDVETMLAVLGTAFASPRLAVLPGKPGVAD